MIRPFAFALALIIGGHALAQTTTVAAPAPAVDPAHLAAAKRTVEAMMPPAQRSAMFEAMLNPMLANMQQALLSRPDIQTALAADPKAKATLDAFFATQQKKTIQLLQTELPGMFAIMERAYARRFTVAQLDEITAFFSTPTGRLYMNESMKIPADPELLGWQRRLMERSMADGEKDLEKLEADLTGKLNK
jgi:hypothetical protein